MSPRPLMTASEVAHYLGLSHRASVHSGWCSHYLNPAFVAGKQRYKLYKPAEVEIVARTWYPDAPGLKESR